MDYNTDIIDNEAFPQNYWRIVGNSFYKPKLVTEEFFLMTNDTCYTSYLIPEAERCYLDFGWNECTLTKPDNTKLVLSNKAPSSGLAGLRISVFYITANRHYLSINKPLLVCDVLANLNDPLHNENLVKFTFNVTSREGLIDEITKIYDEFIFSYLSTYSISLAEWGNRITGIWSNQLCIYYPVCGIRFYNLERLQFYDWYNVLQTINFEDKILTYRPNISPLLISNNYIDSPRYPTEATLYGGDTLVIEWFCSMILLSMNDQKIVPNAININNIQKRELFRLSQSSNRFGITYIPRTTEEFMVYCSNTVLVFPRQMKVLIPTAIQYGIVFR